LQLLRQNHTVFAKENPMQIDLNAPITLEESIVIAAPIETVWQLMSDIPKWPQWNPAITNATLNGPLQTGTTFVWKSGPGSITSMLHAVEAPTLIGWTGTSMGLHVVHLWRFESNGTNTTVTTEESAGGITAWLLKGYCKKTLTEAVVDALQALRVAAEKWSYCFQATDNAWFASAVMAKNVAKRGWPSVYMAAAATRNRIVRNIDTYGCASLCAARGAA
jgi:uncharacterized protein YndB with AHSA1/START domain